MPQAESSLRPQKVAALAVLFLAAASIMPAIPKTGADSRPQARPKGAVLDVEDPRIVVLKSSGKLCLFDGDELRRIYRVCLGVQPVGDKQRLGDMRTPEGQFYVCVKNPDSPNGRFLGISYPHAPAVRRGVTSGLISPGEADRILQSLARGQRPNWTSALGGAIGIHDGLEKGTRTAGCLAVSRWAIQELYDVMEIGDPVEILP